MQKFDKSRKNFNGDGLYTPCLNELGKLHTPACLGVTKALKIENNQNKNISPQKKLKNV